MKEALPMPDIHQAIAGCILGTAVGDAIGLPREGLSPAQARRLFGGPPLRHALVFGQGMMSDDTEHTCMVAQALLASGGDPVRFARSLSWRLRGWLLAFPAGVGLATAKATLKLWVGFPLSKSGVYSAGNGPAMRAAVLGVYAADDDTLLRDLVRASTRLTHTDPRAEQGALVVALAARVGAQKSPQGLNAVAVLDTLAAAVADAQLRRNLEAAREHLNRGTSAPEFAASLGLDHGVTGFVNHTVPVAVYCWLRYHDDFRAAVEAAVMLGGDADTVGAIVGALAGATLGPDAIPSDWLAHLRDWPRSVTWMRRLAQRLSAAAPERRLAGPLPLFWPGLLLRNAAFLAIVLAHGLRRLLPL
jgi:ADP-ribosylglycohydrolase